MHDCAIPLNYKSTDGAQQTLDGSLAPKVHEFTRSILMDYIVELIVSEVWKARRPRSQARQPRSVTGLQ